MFALVALLGGCQLEDEQVGVTAQPQLMLNQLMLNQLMLNALLGNPQSLLDLNAHTLNTDTFDPDLGSEHLSLQLLDPDAVTVMHYLVGCALDDKQSVTWTDPDTDVDITFHGAEGLCPDWNDQLPSDACLEVVSACLLARTNAFGRTVATSHRGSNTVGTYPKDGMIGLGQAIKLQPQVEVVTVSEYGGPLPSFEDCQGEAEGASRSCGFESGRSFVGTCVPGTWTTLNCSGSGKASVRVCVGWRGCEPGSDDVLGQSDLVCEQPITFMCPGRGSFAVMAGGPTSDSLMTANLKAENGVYPASEKLVFDHPEGAFYGNLFNPGGRNSNFDVRVDGNGVLIEPVITSPGLVYLDLWACHHPDFTKEIGWAANRICALVPDDQGDMVELCSATSVGACNLKPWVTRFDKCGSKDGWPVTGDGDYDNCKANGRKVWRWPITTYLDQPCDILEREAGTCGPPILPR